MPAKNDVGRCWDCFPEEELQAEPWAREVQAPRERPAQAVHKQDCCGSGWAPLASLEIHCLPGADETS